MAISTPQSSPYSLKFHSKAYLENICLLSPLGTLPVWQWLATKGHMITLLPLPLLRWGGERKVKGKKLVDLDKGRLNSKQSEQ